MKVFTHAFATPFGPFSVAIKASGAIVATAFGDEDVLRTRMGARETTRDRRPGRTAEDQVLQYCAGERTCFDLLMAPVASSFQQKVWRALARIPFGTTRSYAEIAREIGAPSAARAVGRANATNPICLIVPCHRVIGADGSLTGFAFGETLKRRLLDHEKQHFPAHDAARHRRPASALTSAVGPWRPDGAPPRTSSASPRPSPRAHSRPRC